MAKTSIKGTITEIGDVKTFGASEWKKREVRVREPGNDKYPSVIAIVCERDNVDAFKDCVIGDEIGADCWVNGREYNGRCYVDVKLSKLVEVKHVGQAAAPDEAGSPADDLEPMPF